MGRNSAKTHTSNRARKWETAIRKARTFITNYDKSRWIIAGLAVEVCDITIGGRQKEDVYTLKRFADAIEILPSTLYEWVSAKRKVVDKLTVRQQKDATEKFDYMTFKHAEKMVHDKSTAKQVWTILCGIDGQDPSIKKYKGYQRVLTAILYNAQRPILLKDIPRELIEPIIEKCSMLVVLLKKELEFRDKFSKSELDAIRVGVKDGNVKRLLNQRLSLKQGVK